MRIILALIIALLPAACNHAPQACATGAPAIQTQLYFGLNKPTGGRVSAAEWQKFVSAEIAPRFPEGFTVLDGHGYWLGEQSKKLEAENSRVVIRLHHGSTADTAAIAAIIDKYKSAFQQEAVMRAEYPVCAAF
ncbi:MAG: DUF3574 domain-containing protein [Alphaproteobacteria bacterium]